jgi:hypothetical protein
MFTEDDCKADVIKHIEAVKKNLKVIVKFLEYRGNFHDISKLRNPELKGFTETTEKLRNVEYGTEEYQKCLDDLKPTLEHHYKNNRHHPEHFENGINGMDLLDIIEMFCDWLAATERTKDGDIRKSLTINKKRFTMDDQLYDIFLNTIETMEK